MEETFLVLVPRLFSVDIAGHAFESHAFEYAIRHVYTAVAICVGRVYVGAHA